MLVELDGKSLSRLHRVADPREVWTSEAGDFTPWLADNLDVLADELGITLTLTGTEVPVGDFRLDIQAEDGDGRVVVIENQLGRTDHNHLGQCLVYASGLEASSVVWVTTQFRDEFRRTLDWLNERTDRGIQFFGVEVGVVQIGESGPRAPVFDVVSRPNDWQKDVKQGAGGSIQISGVNAQRQEFFLEVITVAVDQRPEIRVPSRATGNWLSFASGPFGYWCLTVVADGRLRVEAYLDSGDKARNKALFDEFAAQEGVWREKTGMDLAFERLDDKRASRIAAYHPLNLSDPSLRSEAAAWAVRALVSMHDAMNTPLRSRARELKSVAMTEIGND